MDSIDTLRALADHSIRRALGFVGLGACTLMLALSFDPPLALRSGANLLAIACVGLLISAWNAPRRDVRRTELWALLASSAGDVLRRLPRSQLQDLLSGVLRERMVWHAERVGAVAAALWALALIVALVGVGSGTGAAWDEFGRP